MLVLTLDDTGREFKFGRSKAQSILQNLATVREFATSEGETPDGDSETEDPADGSPKV
jgi:hypothetical protein